MRKRRIAFVVALFVLFGARPVAAEHPFQDPPRASVGDGTVAGPCVRGVLSHVLAVLRTDGEASALAAARAAGLGLQGTSLPVVIERFDDSMRGRLEEAGFQVARHYEDLALCTVTVPDLAEAAATWSEVTIRAPHRPIPCVVSEGVALTGAASWHAHGFTGAGAKVAVIDVGFQGLSQAVAAGEIPADVVTVDFTGYGMESLSRHGTAVAEIVHDMAPDAELTLINTYSEVDLGNAKDYCISHGIRVINHSVGYENTGGHDGTGVVCDIANDAAAHGILWANAIGNHAYNHYRGTFVDADGDSLHDFASNPIVEFNSLGTLSPGQTVWIYLSWSAWPTTSEDFDLYLCRKNGGAWDVVASSLNRQTGSQPPTEEVGLSIPSAGEYAVAVRSYRTTQPHDVTILSAFHSLQYRTFAGSLLQPADAVGAFAVGAIAKENWTTGPQEASSSQGPTYDGRTKPEIAGPDRVATLTSGPGFSGTSVASPHVAGAAALIVGAFPQWTLQQAWDCLATHAVDMGSAGQDNVYGWGRLDLPLSIDVDDVAVPDNAHRLVRVTPNPFGAHTRIEYVVRERADVRLSVHDSAGRRIALLALGSLDRGRYDCEWRGTDAGGNRLSPGVYYLRCEIGGAVETRRVLLLR